VPRTRLIAIFGLLTAFIVAGAFAQEKKDPAKDTTKGVKKDDTKKDVKKDDTKKDDAKKDVKKDDTKKDVKKDDTKKDVKKDDTKKDVKKDEPKGDGLALAWKFTVNTPFYQMMDTNTDQNIKVMGLDVAQSQKQTFYFKWTPIKQDGDKWEIKQEIEGIQMKIDIAGNPVSYDSTQEGGANTALSEFFKSLKTSSFTLTFNTKTQKVEEVKGKKDFLDKLTTTNAQLAPLLTKILSDDALKQMADPTFGILPPTAKKVGEKWESTSTLNLGPIGTYENKYVYELKGPDAMNKDLEIISVATTLKYAAPTEASPDLPFKIKSSTLQTKEKQDPGKIVFNRAKGRLESSDVKLAISGSLTIEIGGNATSVELTQTQETKVTTSDKSLLPAPAKKP
jgi:hypothetical protein